MPIDPDLVWIQDVPTDPDFALPGRKGPSQTWVYERLAEGKLVRRDILGRTYVSRRALKRLIFEGIAEASEAPGTQPGA